MRSEAENRALTHFNWPLYEYDKIREAQEP